MKVITRIKIIIIIIIIIIYYLCFGTTAKGRITEAANVLDKQKQIIIIIIIINCHTGHCSYSLKGINVNVQNIFM